MGNLTPTCIFNRKNLVDSIFFRTFASQKTIRDMANLTRNGVVGLELTREEVIDAYMTIIAIERKAQCREVNCDVLDVITEAKMKLMEADNMITKILEEE